LRSNVVYYESYPIQFGHLVVVHVIEIFIPRVIILYDFLFLGLDPLCNKEKNNLGIN